jgi:cytochrome b561
MDASTRPAYAAADPKHPAGRYGAPARFFHWATALMMLVMWPVGLVIDKFYEIEWLKLLLYFIHENLGVTIWLLALARLAYRLRNPPPPLPADTPLAIKGAAHVTHALLYVILLTQPIGGFITTNAWNFPLTFWGLIPLPNPVGEDQELAKMVQYFHWIGGISLLLILVAHIGGALYHLVIRKDGIFQRMT